MDGLRDLSHHRPQCNQLDVGGKILCLRQNYHFGPGEIGMHLKRYRDIAVTQIDVKFVEPVKVAARPAFGRESITCNQRRRPVRRFPST